MGTSALTSILATTDLTASADACLATAASLGEVTGAAVHLLHCRERPGPFGASKAPYESTGAETLVRALVRQRERACGPGWLPTSQESLVGGHVKAISDRAARVGADLIVLGPPHPRFAMDTLIGTTTSDRVLRTARVPCLLAPEPLNLPLRVVLLATDFSPTARRGAELILRWLAGPLAGPADHQVTVVLLCVSAYADPIGHPPTVRALLEIEAQRLTAGWAGRTDVRIEPVLYSAPLAADGIRKVASNRSADLIVVGTQAYHMFTRLFVRSVSAAVARSVGVPILIVPPPKGAEPP